MQRGLRFAPILIRKSEIVPQCFQLEVGWGRVEGGDGWWWWRPGEVGGAGREAVELGGALVWPYDFETCSLLSRRGEPEPSGVSPAGHKSLIVPRINQTEDGPGSVSPSPPPTPASDPPHPQHTHMPCQPP